MLWFHDATWWHGRGAALVASLGWAGLAVTHDGQPGADRLPPSVLRVRQGEAEALSADPAWIRRSRSSGHAAVSVARHLGARRIVLLGADCRVVAGRTHFHGLPSDAGPGLYAHDFLPAWRALAPLAAAAGLTVVNGTVGSAIDCFEFVDPEAEIAACAGGGTD